MVAQDHLLKLYYAGKSSDGVRLKAGPAAIAELPTMLIGLARSEIEVVEPLPQLLDAAQLALGVRQLTGDLLGERLVVPKMRVGRLVLELFDTTAKPLDIQHPLHRGQGGVEGGDIGLTVRIHGSSRYRRRSS